MHVVTATVRMRNAQTHNYLCLAFSIKELNFYPPISKLLCLIHVIINITKRGRIHVHVDIHTLNLKLILVTHGTINFTWLSCDHHRLATLSYKFHSVYILLVCQIIPTRVFIKDVSHVFTPFVATACVPATTREVRGVNKYGNEVPAAIASPPRLGKAYPRYGTI